MSFVWNLHSSRDRNVPFNFTFGFPGENHTAPTNEEYADDDFTFILYTVILPVICSFGVMGNIASFLVLFAMRVKCSSYTYLTVKTASDLVVCALLLLSVIVHGFFFNMDGEDFDLLITLPAASICSGISVCATVAVTLDRLLVLRNPTRPTKPRVCTPPAARRIMTGAIFISVVTNLPYFFIFALKADGFLHPTRFFNSCVYYYYNWVRFCMFGILPSIVLPIATVLLIISIKRVSKQLRHLSCKSQTVGFDPTRMTITLIAIAIFFVTGEVPGHVVSKKAAFVFLYAGDATSVVTDDADLETLRQVSLILGAVNCSINFFILYMLHPPFGKGLKELFCSKKKEKKEKKQVLVNVVYVISPGNVDLNNVKAIKGFRFNGDIPKFNDLSSFISR